MRTAGYVELNFEFHKEDKRWVAYCAQLGTSTFGRSLPETQKRIEEAVLLHLNTLEDVGERRRFFRENNIHFYLRKPKKEKITIDIPLGKTTFIQPYLQAVPA